VGLKWAAKSGTSRFWSARGPPIEQRLASALFSPLATDSLWAPPLLLHLALAASTRHSLASVTVPHPKARPKRNNEHQKAGQFGPPMKRKATLKVEVELELQL